ncbi:hypothetical protein QZH41_018031 [Actinostola sp. cb2023]|nr:hypothetical protein QZH41_018031 [Actinostola sp. cb2023]
MNLLGTLPISFFSTSFCTLVLGVIVMVVLYRYGTHKKRLLEATFPGMPGPKPLFLLGHVVDLIKAKGQLHVFFDRYYKKYGQLFPVSFLGMPALVVSDPEMVKEIFVKNVDCFHERSTKFSFPKPINKLLSIVQGETWRRIRTTLSPSFSAHKLKGMIPLMNLACDTLVKKIDQVAEAGGSFDIVK